MIECIFGMDDSLSRKCGFLASIGRGWLFNSSVLYVSQLIVLTCDVLLARSDQIKRVAIVTFGKCWGFEIVDSLYTLRVSRLLCMYL